MKLNELFEVKAKAFYETTGVIAPGKDVPCCNVGFSIEERKKLWDDWIGQHGSIIDAIIDAMEEHYAEKSWYR